jgi:hypothetical protein
MMPPRQIGATRWRVAVLLERRMGRVVVMVVCVYVHTTAISIVLRVPMS